MLKMTRFSFVKRTASRKTVIEEIIFDQLKTTTGNIIIICCVLDWATLVRLG